MAEHPWELTLGEFIEQVRQSYGIELQTISAGERNRFLIRGSRIYVLPGVEEDEVLTPRILRALCTYFDLPPLDFALDPEEEEDT